MKRTIGLLAALWATVAWSEPTVFERVDVVRIASGDVLEGRFVLVDEGQIQSVSTEPPQLDGAIRIDGDGLYLMPGLAEMHAHIPPAEQAQRVEDVLFLYLSQGLTTVRGMLGEPGHLALREQAARGDIDSPRIIASAPSLNGNSVDSPAAAVAMVRAAHEAGYDHLKIHPGLQPAEFDAIARTANELGMKYVGHVDPSYGARHAIEAGMTGIDHMDGFVTALVPEGVEADPGFFGLGAATQADASRIEPFARLVAEHGTWVVPTETLMVSLAGPLAADDLLSRPEMRYVSAETQQQWRGAKAQFSGAPAERRERFLALRRQLIKALHEAGANLLLGSDAPQVFNVPGFSTHRELALYVDAGLTPREALSTGSLNVARYLGDDQRGEIESGQVADLVLLGSNPLDDIGNAADIRGVMVSGRWYDAATISQRLDQIAARAGPAR